MNFAAGGRKIRLQRMLRKLTCANVQTSNDPNDSAPQRA
jgi:hypothetical protein